MLSKKLTQPAPKAETTVVVPVKKDIEPKIQHESQHVEHVGALSQVYNFHISQGKQLKLPKRDDALVGGYSDTSFLGTSVAKRYMQAKRNQQTKEAKQKEMYNKQMNPFNDLM